MYFSSSSALLLYSLADFILYSFWSCKIQANRSYGIAHPPTFGPVSKFWSHCIYPMKLQTVGAHCTRVIDKSSVCFCVINNSLLYFVHVYLRICIIVLSKSQCSSTCGADTYILQNSIAVLVVVTTALAELIYKNIIISVFVYHHFLFIIVFGVFV